MIRLTLTLLVGIGVTMAVAGRDLDHAQGSDVPERQDAVEVARADTDLDNGQLLALSDESGAVERALAATASYEPEPESSPAVAETTPETSADLWVVTGSRVNLRAGPSTTNAVVGQVSEGQTAEMIEDAGNGWYHIRLPESGADAYIYGRFLERRAG